ncbi:MAG: outer membrane protein assembly factor BamD [Bacteroidia bacterium]|nr:outer membrane protein assembly factor BamD [Bacteroidia bacterium]
MKTGKYIAILTFLVLTSCSEYSKVVKNGTNEQKMALGNKLYEKKDYVRAVTLYEDLLAFYRGKTESEDIYLNYAYCYYGMGQYELAAFHFKNFTENFFNSKHTEECSYRYVSCLYLGALPYELDQSNTTKAISEIQLFLNQYPNSIYKDFCNNHIDELRKSLMTKSYQAAQMYFKMDDYLAAMVTFKNTLKDFPDIENKEEIEYLIARSAYMYAKNSIEEKKEERYNNVFAECKEYYRNNTSAAAHYIQVQELEAKAKVELDKHKKLNKIQ